MDPKRTTPRHIIVKMPKVMDKERILKAARKSRELPTKELPYGLFAYFSKELCRQEGAGKK